jgi:hypothetical protein
MGSKRKRTPFVVLTQRGLGGWVVVEEEAG